ncbi:MULTISPECIES: hypothetical protein [unclassified Nocardia]|uniref:hypothetical protein n=1 Tax=Nocardia sp. NPDC056064 TaxID=3345701 RepID=UPI0035DC47D7
MLTVEAVPAESDCTDAIAPCLVACIDDPIERGQIRGRNLRPDRLDLQGGRWCQIISIDFWTRYRIPLGDNLFVDAYSVRLNTGNGSGGSEVHVYIV